MESLRRAARIATRAAHGGATIVFLRCAPGKQADPDATRDSVPHDTVPAHDASRVNQAATSIAQRLIGPLE